jgi:hypothetical protein
MYHTSIYHYFFGYSTLVSSTFSFLTPSFLFLAGCFYFFSSFFSSYLNGIKSTPTNGLNTSGTLSPFSV